MVNPFASNVTAFVLAWVSSHHTLGQPDHSKFKYQVLYTENGDPITVQMPQRDHTAIPTTKMEIHPSPTTFTLADRMCQQLANIPGPSQGRIPVTTMEILENIKEAEIDEGVGSEESGNPGDPGGLDPDSPGGPGAPCGSCIPSHSRSLVE
ncbi:hypothetical protein J3R30DRAFT_3716950 [Lentinula aciculospora]|uniref:Uncharacterized protein n=1 Tax=Lentinula aciculospora TaxID=153920 RepID=A0A9W8ZUU6_9AGAR|nr:hypothetical protein J3R30DRAFT_3716950 [Lentinula aciculospora]